MARLLRLLPLGQGLYFLLTAVWALVSIGTFQLVTGPKTDLWLVRTVAVLVGVIGSVLLVAWARDAVTLEVALLAAGSALGLAAIDVFYVVVGRISPVYLLDAAAELALLLGWGLWALRRESGSTPSATRGPAPRAGP